MVTIPIIKEFTDAIKSISPIFNDLKNSMTPYATYYSFFITNVLPFDIPTKFLANVLGKVTIVWSNVPGLVKALRFADTNQTGVAVLVGGGLQNVIQICSIGNFMGMGPVTLGNGMLHTDEFLEMYIKNLNLSLDVILGLETPSNIRAGNYIEHT